MPARSPTLTVHRETTSDDRPGGRGFSSSSTDLSDSEESGPPAEHPSKLPQPLVSGGSKHPPDAGGAAAAIPMHSLDEPNRYAPLILVCHGNVIRYLTLKALQLNTAAWLRLIVPQCVHASALFGAFFDDLTLPL